MPDVTGRLNPRTEGDRRSRRHARSCGARGGECLMSCRCWCHGIKHHPNGVRRPDAQETPR